MPALEQVETPKIAGFVSKGRSKNQERIEQDEKEIEELERQLRGETETPEKTGNNAKTKETEDQEDDNTEDENLTREEQTYKKRYGDLRRHQQKVEKDLKEKIEALEKRLEAKPEGIVPPKSDEDIEAWMKKYPDVAGIVSGLIAKETEKRLAKTNTTLQKIQESEEAGKLEKARRAIIKAHSDFEDLEASDEFHDWVDEQPSWIANALYDNADDPKAVIRVLDLYKADNAGITPRKKEEKDAASDVSTKGRRTSVDADSEKGTIRESDVAKMSDAEYAKNEDAIMEAMKTGKFIYDMTGGAR